MVTQRKLPEPSTPNGLVSGFGVVLKVWGLGFRV